MTSGNWIKEMVAGFVATVVISALMLMKTMMGVMPELNPIKMMSGMLGAPPGGRLGDALHDRDRAVGYAVCVAQSQYSRREGAS